MTKYILLAALAAIAMPSGALARPHHGGDRHHSEGRYDRHEVRRDRHELRRDRRDYRYDARDYRRDRHHARHVRYVAPYRGWSYRPVRIGYRLRPVFYGPRYYISDYGYYGVYAPRPWERWIRYGNDLLLVNIRTGIVVAVVHYRYW
jgi:Ni/Co efflux regulator RcnB